MKHKKVVRVTATEFELDDGTVFEHPVELEEVPTQANKRLKVI
jgi:hypothetical protein